MKCNGSWQRSSTVQFNLPRFYVLFFVHNYYSSLNRGELLQYMLSAVAEGPAQHVHFLSVLAEEGTNVRKLHS